MSCTITKRERCVVGMTNKHSHSASISPRRPEPHLESIKLLEFTMSQKCRSSTDTTPRSSRGGDPFGRSPRLQPVGDTQPNGPQDLRIQTSPRNQSQDENQNEASLSKSTWKTISEAARINGMRALLFDKGDSKAVAPPLPAPPIAQTRFSARQDKDTHVLVEATEGAPSHGSKDERFRSSGKCHMDSTIGSADRSAVQRRSDARADAARSLQVQQVAAIQHSDNQNSIRDQQRVVAKTQQQQKYAANKHGSAD